MTRLFLLFGLCVASAAFADPEGWTAVANPMQDGRWAPTSARLGDGRTALIAGGFSYHFGGCVATADRFDERTNRFVPTKGRLHYPRDFATGTLLPSGQVLIAGGYNTVLGTLETAELYDPVTDAFILLSSRLSSWRELFTATLLSDGRVLLAGGFDTHRHVTQSSADLYDPTTQTFTPTGTLLQDRFGQAAVRLADGRVLVVGGKHWRVGQPDVPLASAELYDPATGRWHRAAGDMSVPRDRPTATLLPDGHVLVAGGQNGADEPMTAELFDPRTERFSVLTSPLAVPRMAHADTLLPNGRVLLAGGWSSPRHATTSTTELYDPLSQTFTPGPTVTESGHDQALVAFPDGLVLVAGGKQVEDGREDSSAKGAVWRVPVESRETP